MDDNMIYNALQCLKCGDVVESLHRHHYSHCKCGNISNDGGTDSGRSCGWKEGTMKENLVFLCLYSHSPIEDVREKLKRYNNRKQKYFLLKEIDGEWLDGIIEYYIPKQFEMGAMPDKFLINYIKEKQYRNLNLELI